MGAFACYLEARGYLDRENAESIERDLETFNENSGEGNHAGLRLTDNGPVLVIDGVEITSGETEVRDRIAGINRELGYNLL